LASTFPGTMVSLCQPANIFVSYYCVLTFHFALNHLHTAGSGVSSYSRHSFKGHYVSFTLMHPSIYNSDHGIVPAPCHCSILMYIMCNSSSVSLHRLESAGSLHEFPLSYFNFPPSLTIFHLIVWP